MISGLRLYLIIGAVALGVSTLGVIVYKIRKDAVASYRIEQTEKEVKKVREAEKANDASRRCSLDPDCRLSNDGYRRD